MLPVQESEQEEKVGPIKPIITTNCNSSGIE
jgi:hypothetical protein